MRRLHRLLLTVTLAVIPAAAQIVVNPPVLTNPQWTVNRAYSQGFSATGCDVACTLEASGDVPPGVSLPLLSNTLSGTPSGPPKTYIFTITAKEGLNSGSRTYSLTINAPPSITTTPLPTGTVGTGYSGSVVATGGTAPLTFSVSVPPGMIPPGLTFTSGGTFTGIPTTPGTYSFTVTVTDLAGATASQLLSITINAPPPIITTTSLPATSVGATYNQTIAYTPGTVGTHTFAITLGSLPNLLILSSSGVITGTPTGPAGTATFTVTVTDSVNATDSKALSIVVNPAPTITTASLPSGTQTVAYSTTLAATGGTGTLTFSATGLPAWLNLSAAGVLSGTPTAFGDFNITFRITDSVGAFTEKPLTLTIAPQPVITGLSPSTATAGSPGFTLTVNGSGFVSGSIVQWAGNALATNFVSATQLTATVPAVLVAAPGSVNVTVFNVGPVTSAPAIFTISAPPAITGLSPSTATAGSPGFTLTVNGSGFVSGSIVQWAGNALATNFVSAGQLTATVPAVLVATPGSVNVTVVNPGPVTSAPAIFTINAPPAISSLSPSSAIAGAPGFTLTVTGSGFVSNSMVQWAGNALATNFVSATQLTATVPAVLVAAAGSFNVTVVNPGPVTSAPSVFTVGAAPAISSLTPSSISAGAPGFNLIVSGSGFVSASIVQWAGTPLSTTFVNATQLTAAIPANLVAAAGSVNITVLSPGPVTSAPAVFTIGGAPAISSLSPASAIAGVPTFTLTVSGTNFAAASVIHWAGTALATTFVNATQLTAVVPASLVAAAGSFNVTVVNPGPVTSAPSVFTVGAAPAISLLSPSSISAGAPAFNLTVSGSGFVSTSIVQWAGTPLSTTFVNATQLTAAVPASLLVNPGSFNITVLNPGPVTSAPATFTVGAAPSITAINPIATTAAAPIFTLTVTGSGFNATSVIRMSGQALVTTFLSPNQLSTLITPTMIPTATNLSITVANAGPVVSNAASLLVNAQTQVITSTLTPGLIGVAYSQALNISGGTPPFQFAFANGNFPPGLSLNPTNGAITGTPTTSGSYDFAIQVTDAAGFVVTRVFNLVIARSLSISTEAALPTGAVGLAYSVQLVATGGLPPYSNWQVTTGSLPPGINLNAATGLLSGTPTATGSYAFLIQVRDSAAQIANKGFTLVINAGLSITSTSQPPTAIIGTAFQFALTAAGGTQPYTWSVAIGTMPAGLTLNASNGAITGTPTTAGTSTVTIEVKDTAGQTARAPYTFEVISGLSITNPTAIPNATARVAYSNTFQASGGTAPYSSWRIVSGTVPSPLVLDSLTGVLSGAPANPGNYSFTIAVNDSNSRTVSKAFTLTVLPPGLAITSSATLPAATFGTPYTFTLQADGGTIPYSWVLGSGSLPAGVSLSSSGVISGIPTAVGSSSFSITVLDSAARSSSRDFTMAVNSPALPAYTLSGPADTIDAATQQRIAIDLSASYPTALSGTIVITFTTDTVNAPPGASDDPALQFANGTRSLRFTIPAGSTSAEFEGTPAFQLGTLAGTIVLTSSFATGSTSVPSVTPPRTIRILRAAPTVRAASVTRTSSGFDVTITGFSTPREVTQALFRFTASSGANLQTNELTLPLTTPATVWFSSDASRAFGGQFTYRQSFTLSGESNAIVSLSVTLSNSTGASQPVSANVP